MEAYDATKEEYSNAVRNMKAEKAKDIASLRTDNEELQALATETQDELEKYMTKNESLKEAMAERNKMMDDLLACNKGLEEEKHQKDYFISDLQDRWKNYLKESEEVKRRSAQLRFEKEKEINSHLDALDDERSLREELQQQVLDLTTKLEDTKMQVKSTAELKAENYLLQDKIDRQDAYLKRKLENDKKRGKMPVSVVPTMKSPPRPSSARSRSVTRKSVDQPRLTLGAQRSRSSRSLSLGPLDGLELQRSASDELDELLGVMHHTTAYSSLKKNLSILRPPASGMLGKVLHDQQSSTSTYYNIIRSNE